MPPVSVSTSLAGGSRSANEAISERHRPYLRQRTDLGLAFGFEARSIDGVSECAPLTEPCGACRELGGKGRLDGRGYFGGS